MKTEKHCQRHGPMSHPYCVECLKDDHAKEKADDRLGATACSASSEPPTNTEMTIDQLIDQLVTEGGAIVSSGECSEMEIADAQATGRFSVREDGMGFVRRYAEWLALQLEREKLHQPAAAIAAETDTPESDAVYGHCVKNSGPMTGIRMLLKMQELERARDLARRGIDCAINGIGLMGEVPYDCREERDHHAKKIIERLEGYLISPLNVPAMASADTQTPQANGQP